MNKHAKLIKIVAFAMCLCTALVMTGCKGKEVQLPEMPKLIIGSASLQINNGTISNVADTFEAKGNIDKFVEPHQPTNYSLFNDDNDKIVVGVYNDDANGASMQYDTCRIYDVNITKDRFQNTQITLSNGVNETMDLEEIVEIMGESHSSTADGLSTIYCWNFSDGYLYLGIETGNGKMISLRMLSNVDPTNPNA